MNELRIAGVKLHFCGQRESVPQRSLHRFPQSVDLVPRVRLQPPADHRHVPPPEELQGLHQDFGASSQGGRDLDVGVVDVAVVHFGGLSHKAKHRDAPS